jgi:hypothetical protein
MSSWKFFDVAATESPNVEWKKRDGIILWLILFGWLAAIATLYFTNLLPPPAGVIAFAASLVGVGLRIGIYVWEKVHESPAFDLRKHLQWFLVLCVGAWSGFLVLTIMYDIGFLALFSPEWTDQLFWFIALIYASVAVLGVYNIYKSYLQKQYTEIVVNSAVVAIPLLLLVMIFAGVKMTRWVPYLLGLIITVVILLFMVYHTAPDQRRKSLELIGVSMAILWVVMLFIVDPFEWFQASVLEAEPAVIYSGAVNPFSTVFYLFFQHGVAPTMIAIMTFGAIVYVFAKTFGDMIQAGQAIGAILMIVPSMIIIMMIFSGSIEAPTQLVDLLGAGVANFIYAVAETGVFTIVMTLLLTFTGMVKALLQ